MRPSKRWVKVQQETFTASAIPDSDQILAQLKRGASKSKEQDLVQLLQKRYAQLAPVIPLFPNPQWGAANSKNIIGFPSQEEPYAPLSPNREPECLLVFDHLKPRTYAAELSTGVKP